MTLKLNRTENDITRIERQKINDNWTKIENDFNNAIENISEEAFEKVVDSAKLIWKEPVDTFADLTTTYPNAKVGWTAWAREIVNGVSKAYRFNGTTWVLQQEFLGDAINEVDHRFTEELTETNKRAFNYTKYGNVWLPTDYRDFILSRLPFDLFRGQNGHVKHDFNFENELNRYTKIYLRKHDSSNTNDGLTPNTPLTTVANAVILANSLNKPVTFVFMDKFTDASYTEFLELNNATKNYNITSYNELGTFFGGGLRSRFNWVADGDIFKTGRTATVGVMDYNNRDVNGIPKPFTKVESLGECRNKYMSFYTDGTDVWINYNIQAGVNYDIGVLLNLAQEFSLNLSSKRVIINNIGILCSGKSLGSIQGFKLTGNLSSEVYVNGLKVQGASLNGLAEENIGKFYVFNSVSKLNGVDGFNYHGTEDDFIFEYDCYAQLNGTSAQMSANATTAHDGMTILRVGTIGEDCYGPLSADVGGCISINIDCKMYNSLLASGSTKAAFYGSDSGASSPGELWLINCEGGGDDTFTLYYPNLPNSKSVKVINLKGTDIEPRTQVDYIV